FVFDDANLGARFSGNWDHNLWQYNLVFFDMLDKDTNSGLNEFEERDQQILIANVYHQDWPVDGYTTELSFHYNNDHRGVHFDDYTSGDEQTRNGKAHGFDAILDAPNFAGGGFSFFNSQALRLLGVNLTNAGSPIPDLQSSQTEGHSNFVNPGILILGGALDF